MLSSDDPVRVFQEFATLDLLSGGRAEIMAGRGSFIESFPLFGYDLDDYDELFAEKLELLLAAARRRARDLVGRPPPPLDDLGVYPRPVQDPLPVWVAVGGTPASAVARRARSACRWRSRSSAAMPERFAPFAELHREAARQAGHEPPRARASTRTLTSPRPRRQAADEFFPPLRGDDERDRPRARLAADRRARASTRCAHAARRALRRQPRGGGREDPVPARALRPRPLPRPDQRRVDAAREGAAGDRAVRHRGRAARADGARVCGAG